MTSPYPRGTIIVYNDSSIWGEVIRRGSGGHWTHVAMALGDGTAIQCSPFLGVRLGPDFQQETLAAFPYPGNVERVMSFYQWRMAQGDKYDFVGLLADPLYNALRITMPLHTGRWNCATFLVNPMLSDPAVTGKLLNKPASTFTPNDFYVMFGASS